MLTKITNVDDYINQSYRLVASIIVNHFAIIADNRDDINLNVTDVYTHLRGEYLPDDEPIVIPSEDGVGSFTLTKDNLIDRPFTRQSLMGDAGLELKLKYPDRALLISGILSPISKFTKLEDGDFFDMHINAIEYQERTLMYDLQQIAQNFRSKHDLNAYLVTDRYFSQAYLGMLHMALIVHTLNLRHARINTPEAHNFHVYHKLASNDVPESVSNYLQENMRRWLYKNIRFVHNSIGSVKTLKYLIDGFLNKTDYTVTGYAPRLQLDDNMDVINPAFEPIAYKNSPKEYRSLDEYSQNREKTTRGGLLIEMMRIKSGHIGYTKNILVSKNIQTNGSQVSFNSFVMYMLLYNVFIDAYVSEVKIDLKEGDHFITTIEKATALIFAHYMHKQGLGATQCYISVPIVYVRSPLSTEYITKVRDKLTHYNNTKHEELDVLILSGEDIPTMKTSKEFLDWCVNRYEKLCELTLYVNSIEDIHTRCILQAVLYDMYPPHDSIQLSTAGSTWDDIIKLYGDFSEDNIQSVLIALTLTDPDEEFGPWLTSTIDVMNRLTTYSTKFSSDNYHKHIDFDYLAPELLSIEII